MENSIKDNAGIDYSMGMSNVNHDTGIHYGVIHHGVVGQSWYDSSQAYYGDMPEDEAAFDFADPLSFYYEKDGYSAEQKYDDPDIFILKSPFYTLCAFCSPCAPGAGYIMDSRENGIKAYCFGHDWFEDGKAPYKVFNVSDNMEVLPDGV
jgi:hypothetical protein